MATPSKALLLGELDTGEPSFPSQGIGLHDFGGLSASCSFSTAAIMSGAGAATATAVSSPAAAGQGFVINLIYDDNVKLAPAGFQSALNYVVNFLESTFTIGCDASNAAPTVRWEACPEAQFTGTVGDGGTDIKAGGHLIWHSCSFRLLDAIRAK